MLSAIMASIVATKNQRKSRCWSAAKATFFSGRAVFCECEAGFVETKLFSGNEGDHLGDNGYFRAMQIDRRASRGLKVEDRGLKIAILHLPSSILGLLSSSLDRL